MTARLVLRGFLSLILLTEFNWAKAPDSSQLREVSSKESDRYFEMSCHDLLEAETKDSFLIFLRKGMAEDSIHIGCSQLELKSNDENFVSEAQFSKMIDSYYQGYLSSEK